MATPHEPAQPDPAEPTAPIPPEQWLPEPPFDSADYLDGPEIAYDPPVEGDAP